MEDTTPCPPAKEKETTWKSGNGKILERIIYCRLLAVAEKKNVLSNTQFGFRKSRSTVDAISGVVDTAAGR